MQKRFGLFACTGALAAAMAVATPTLAAVDAYMQIDGVVGDSADRPGWIEVNSFQWGVARGVGSPMGGAADRESSAPSVSEIVVTKSVDRASPLLSSCSAKGCHYPTVILAVRKAGGSPTFLQYKLTDVMITSYRVSSGGDRPSESVSFRYATISTEGQPTPATGRPMSAVAPARPARQPGAISP